MDSAQVVQASTGQTAEQAEAARLAVARLVEIFSEMPAALLAFSGGVDSGVLAAAAYLALGGRALAVTVDSALLARRDLHNACDLAAQIGIRHRVVESRLLDDKELAGNPLNRCYLCKIQVFTRLQAIAEEEQLPVICYGENLDDHSSYRPGTAAAESFAVRAPLSEAGLDKAAVRQVARYLKLPVWDRPANACLATRLPYGFELTPQRLAQIEAAEDFLHEMGLRQCRVRHHGDLARLELLPEDVAVVMAQAKAVARRLKSLGFAFVTLDLEGFRSGSYDQAVLRSSR